MRTRGQNIAHNCIHEGMTEEEIAAAIDMAIKQCSEAAKAAELVSLRECIKTLGWIMRTIEMDFMLDGVWVDNPSLLIRSIHEEADKIVSKAAGVKFHD